MLKIGQIAYFRKGKIHESVIVKGIVKDNVLIEFTSKRQQWVRSAKVENSLEHSTDFLQGTPRGVADHLSAGISLRPKSKTQIVKTKIKRESMQNKDMTRYDAVILDRVLFQKLKKEWNQQEPPNGCAGLIEAYDDDLNLAIGLSLSECNNSASVTSDCMDNQENAWLASETFQLREGDKAKICCGRPPPSSSVFEYYQDTILHSEFTVLRTEQDREYQDAVEADLRFRELKDCEETAQALLIQEKQNQMEHQRDMELLKLNCRDVYLQHTRNSLETEPEFESNDVITIRFMLPRKERISRRFVKTDKIQKIQDYLEVYFADNEMDDIRRFTLSTPFPKKVFSDMEATLEDENLVCNCTIFVHDVSL